MYPNQFPPVPQAYRPRPRPVPLPPPDRVAVILGNAAFLSIGYMLLRRTRFALVSLVGTFTLLTIVALVPDSVVWRIVLGLWWIAMVLHAWWLTRRTVAPLVDLDEPRPAWRARTFACAAAGLVLLSVVWLRFDTWMTVEVAEDAHRAGDCERAAGELDDLDAAHRIVSGAATLEGEAALEACRMVLRAFDEESSQAAATLASYMELDAALWEGAGPQRGAFLLRHALVLGGSEAAMEEAFAQLRSSLSETPDQAGRVQEVVEEFLADLDGHSAVCEAVRVDDWLQAGDWSEPEIGGPIGAAWEPAGDRRLACARVHADADELEGAESAYERFLADFPDHAEAEAAASELYAVETAIQRVEVGELLSNDEYCQNPSPYRAAPAYEGSGPHAMWAFGIDPFEYDFPESWNSGGIDDTVLVVCVDGPRQGDFLEQCHYEDPINPFGASPVSFYASEFKVTAYELRTGENVADYTVDFDGNPCPEVLHYEAFSEFAPPPSEVDAEVSAEEVRSVFHRLMD